MTPIPIPTKGGGFGGRLLRMGDLCVVEGLKGLCERPSGLSVSRCNDGADALAIGRGP